MNASFKAIARLALVLVLALAAWAASKYGAPRVPILPVSAPASQFSALRAAATEARILGPEVPHPASTPANAAVHQRVLAELRAMNIPARSYTDMGCIEERRTFITCGTVTDIVAEVIPGEGKAITMMAHLDSVPAGPGAADDGSGVATLLETARALRARGGASLHPVTAVFTDGEEYGLLGAEAFLDDAALSNRVGVVLNMEARGNQGPSRMFQTSTNASALINLYAQSVPVYATSSLYAEIYKALPNDTDLTPFLAHGFTGMNFAFIDRVAHYHTARDTLANLSRQSLQQHGDNLLGMVTALERTPYAALSGHDEIYMDLYGSLLPRLPQGWALPLALVLGLIVLLAALALSAGSTAGERLRASLIVPVLLLLAGLTGWVMVLIAQGISGMPEPGYAHPAALRLALGLSVVAALVVSMRLAPARAAIAGVWIWIALLGIVAAWLLPGFSPYFLLPMAAAALLLPLAAVTGLRSGIGQIALLLSALAMIAIWMPLAASGEGIMGLKLHPLLTLPAALALATAVPFLTLEPLSAGMWRALSCLGAGLAGVAAIVAGLQPAFSREYPQRLNITYLVDRVSHRTVFAADANAPLPAGLRRAARFSPQPEPLVPSPWGNFLPAYLAKAPDYAGPLPSAEVLSDSVSAGRRSLILQMHGVPGPMAMALVLPQSSKLQAAQIGTHAVRLTQQRSRFPFNVIACMSSDCAAMKIKLVLGASGPLHFDLIEWQKRLPAAAGPLLAARPATAVQSQNGDGTIFRVPLAIPAVQ